MATRTVFGSMIALFLLLCSTTYAEDWRQAACPIQKHDFGVVAVGAKTEFRFPITNTFGNNIHIRSVRTSCGCTTAIVENEYIAPGQTGAILARFNTGKFNGKRGATITAVIDQPFLSEIRLRVDGYIRKDIVFFPGSIEFGKVSQGDASTKQTKLMYAGRPDWKILELKSNHAWLNPVFEQTTRQGGRVDYQLIVKLREDAPQGFFQDELTLVTNDTNMPRVPLKVSGQVESPLSISPQAFSLGRLKPGEPAKMRLAIKGQAPFLIKSIDCEGWKVDFDLPAKAKVFHIINANFTPIDVVGPQKKAVVITTDGDASVSAKAILTAEVRDQ